MSAKKKNRTGNTSVKELLSKDPKAKKETTIKASTKKVHKNATVKRIMVSVNALCAACVTRVRSGAVRVARVSQRFSGVVTVPRARTIFLSAMIVCVAAMLFFGAYAGGRWHETRLRDDVIARAIEKEELAEQQHMHDVTAVQDHTDISTWKTHRSAWYGFTVMHPADWRVRQMSKTANKNKAIYRVGFFKPTPSEDVAAKKNVSSPIQQQEGFEVAVYDLQQTPQVADTDEYPRLRASADHTTCQVVAGRLYETGDYPAEEFYVPFDDPCYDPVLFYMLVDGQYMYTITPVTVTENGAQEDLMVAVTNRIPEYFSAASQFRNIDIVRPKPKPVTPVVNAPHPVWYKRDALGRKVCAKKNDKPGKSKTNKKKHMDMECCLDPDEYPNPHCYYDPAKYGKYLP